MRIGIFTDSYKPYISGVTTSIEMLKEGLEEQGHEVYIITTKLNGKNNKYFNDDFNVIRVNGIPLVKNGMKDFRLSFFNDLKVKKLLRYNFDIIHIHTEFTIGDLGLKYAKKKNVPYIYTAHTMWEDYFEFISNFLAKHAKKQMLWGLKKLLNRYSKNASYTIVPSEKMMNKLMEYQMSAKYEIVPTGIDIMSFFPENNRIEKMTKLKEKLKIDDNDFCYLYLGRVSKEKSIETLLDAFMMLEYTNIKFIIVGSGNRLEELKEKVNKYNVCDKVIFTGEVPWEDVKYYYGFADCFLNASTSETQGLTYIEALASGLPVILKNDSVLKNLVKNEENGLLYNSTEELMGMMKLVYVDSEIRKNLSKNALKSVEKFSKECYTNNVLNLYQKAIRENMPQ